MSYASTIFAFLVALTGTLVSGCFLSREPDTQSMYRKGKTGSNSRKHDIRSWIDWYKFEKLILSSQQIFKTE